MKNITITFFLTVASLAALASGAERLVPSQYSTIQSAIDAAVNGDTVIVAPGTYTGPGNRDLDFLGKAITVRSTDPNAPNIVAQTIIDCNGTGRAFHFHSGEDANSVLAGFTITNAGNGGIYCYSSSPMIINCVISENFNRGIYCYRGSPVISNCTISENIFGSGIWCYNSSPIITSCIISGNTTTDRGGGIYCSGYESSPTITNCTITGNFGGSGGGGIYCDYSSSPVITNCAVTGNSTVSNGGGIYCAFSSSSVITGCTITGNEAWCGGGIYSDTQFPRVENCTISGNSAEHNGGGIYNNSSTLSVITNSIVWGNADTNGTGQSAQIYGVTPNISFSCIQDDNPDDANIPFGEFTSNIDDDPCFVAPGFWDANVWHDGDYHLLLASPCIDTGDPYFPYHVGDLDMDGQPRLMGRYIDMGADEVEVSVIVVTKPKGGEVWTGGSTHEINWDSYGITGMVDISYSTNNGANWTKIANVPDTGSFIWELPTSQFPWLRNKPPIDSSRCLVSVKPHVPVPNFIRIGSGPFTIQPYRSWPPWPCWPICPQRLFGPRYGCVKWQFQTGGPVNAGVTLGLNNRVHVPCEDGKLYTLNPAGKLLWTYDTNSPLVCSPAVDRSGNVYVGAENGKLYAIGINGRLLWTHTTDGPVYSSPVVLFNSPLCGYPWPCWKPHFPPWQQPVQVLVCSVDGTLYALGQDGSELWTFETDSLSAVTTGAIFASPAINRSGTIHIAGLYDPNLYALDSNSDDIKWNRNFSSPSPSGRRPWPFASPVIAKDGTIYQALLYDPNLYAISPNDGSILWAANMADPCSGWFEPNYATTYGPAACWSKPALAPNGTIYVNLNDPYLRAVDPNGTIKWVTKLGTIGGFTLTVGGDGLIYAASDDARLYVVDRNGLQVSQFEGSGGLSFPTITMGRAIIISDANNTVWAISPYNCWGQPLALHKPVE